MSFIVVALTAISAEAASHVRVVLDVSGSLVHKDPGRKVILATLLLYDLARPNTTLDDTFKVLPFDEEAQTLAGSWEWKDPSAPVPVAKRPWIVAVTNHRRDFVRTLDRQTYDSDRTYFYPGILRSIEDLERVSQAKDDNRVIVLVTDGLPELNIRDREAELIRRDLVPRLEQHGIRLYVLAFSQEAYSNLDFFDSMLRGSSPVPLGASFVDPTGDQLLDNMLQIFGRSFGYTPDQARSLPGVSDLNLEKNVAPERVAVVVSSSRPQPPERLALKAPPGGKLNNPGGMQRASEPGGSYALRWVLVPDRGLYGFDTDVTQGSVAVLRPTRLDLEIRPVPPNSVSRTMARTRLPLRILVRSPTGTGDPGLAGLSFQPFGPKSSDPEGDPYRWQGDEAAALSSTGQLTAEGRIYEIEVEFPENQDDPSEIYKGFLEIQARRGEARVGSLSGDLAHMIEVHPLLSITPFPAAELASTTTLDAGDSGCTHFDLALAQGNLPHANPPEYGLSAVLQPDSSVIDEELHEATFTLDGYTLELAGQGTGTGDWSKGRALSVDELLGPHEICVNLGEPTRGKNPLEVPLAFTLHDSPYDEFDVVEPFTLRIPITNPSILEKWGGWMLAALALLSLLASLWYLRDRPCFPEDLRYAIGREGSSSGLIARSLPDGSSFSRLLGLVVERPIKAPGESRLLGRVRPVDEELYRLRTARGVRIEATEPGVELARRGKLVDLEARRTYRLRNENGTFLFRMEYQ